MEQGKDGNDRQREKSQGRIDKGLRRKREEGRRIGKRVKGESGQGGAERVEGRGDQGKRESK